MRTSLVVSFLLAFTLPVAARADWVPVLPGAAGRVVASPTHAAVESGGVVWILHDDGSIVGRVESREPGTRAGDARASHRESEEILDFLDIAEADRDSDWAQDLLDDERTQAQRRSARPPAATPPASREAHAVLAAGGTDIWIAGRRGLLRVGPHGDVVREHETLARTGALAISRPRLIMAGPDGLTLVALDHGEDRFWPLASPARKLALSASGRRWAWAGSAGFNRAGEDASTETFLPAGDVLDLGYCGETLVVLTTHALLALPAGGALEVRSRDTHGRRLVCPGEKASPWLMVGEGLRISFDEGRRWQAIDTPAGLDIIDVAAPRHHVWLATRQGLYFSSEGSDEQSPAAPSVSGRFPRRHRRSPPPSWLSWLPKMSVRAMAAFAPAGRQLEAVALAAFPLDPRQLPLTTLAIDEPVGPPAEVTQARRPALRADLRDPDADCLSLARRKSVELAMTEPERAASYVSRAGHAAWLPELRVLVSRRYGRSESLDVGGSSTALSSPLGIDTVNDIRYEARATWDLAKLVFSAEELAAQTQALHMAELRRDIENNVNRLYFERRRLALDIGGTDGTTRHLRAAEIAAELDSLSAGAFGACTARSSPGDR
jgi:hypothetical protein